MHDLSSARIHGCRSTGTRPQRSRRIRASSKHGNSKPNVDNREMALQKEASAPSTALSHPSKRGTSPCIPLPRSIPQRAVQAQLWSQIRLGMQTLIVRARKLFVHSVSMLTCLCLLGAAPSQTSPEMEGASWFAVTHVVVVQTGYFGQIFHAAGNGCQEEGQRAD